MRAVKSNQNLSTEITLIKIFKQRKIKGWRRGVNLLGKPDFYFPNFIIKKPAIIEVKPELPHPDSDEAKKIIALSNALHPQTAILMLIGSPNPDQPIVMANVLDGNISGATLGYIDYPQHEQFCVICFDVEHPQIGQIIACPEGLLKTPDGYDALVFTSHKIIVDALIKARSARFEHGEQG